jgi:hypothetical protein
VIIVAIEDVMKSFAAQRVNGRWLGDSVEFYRQFGQFLEFNCAQV